MLEDSQASVVVTQERLLPVIPQTAAQVVCLDRDWAELAGLPAEAPVSGPDTRSSPPYVDLHLGLDRHAEGRRGRRTAALVEPPRVDAAGAGHRGRRRAARGHHAVVRHRRGLELYLPLDHRRAASCVAPADAAADARWPSCSTPSRATVMQATPATWRMLLDAGWAGRAGLKVLCRRRGAARRSWPTPLPRPGVRLLWNMYGPTETTVCVDAAHGRDAGRPATIGRPIANTTLYVLDARLRPAADRRAGELYIGGAGVARGYLGRPELTAERSSPDPFARRPDARLYRTGDLARCRADGDSSSSAALDHQVKMRGYRIELGEIEARSPRHGASARPPSSPARTARRSSRLVAYVVPVAAPGPAAGPSCARYLRGRCPTTWSPRRSSCSSAPAAPRTASSTGTRCRIPDTSRSASSTLGRRRTSTEEASSRSGSGCSASRSRSASTTTSSRSAATRSSP